MILRQLRYTVAGLRRRPAFAATAILSIGIGIGAATTVLSVLITLLVRPLPYAAPDRLVAIWPGKGLASREVEAIQQQATKLARVSSLSPGWLMSLTHVAVPQQVDAGRTSGDLFGLIGVPAFLGRPFGAEAEVPGQDHVAVLSYDLWQSQFAGDRSIIGRSIVLNSEPYTVLAVMPKGFRAFTFTVGLVGATAGRPLANVVDAGHDRSIRPTASRRRRLARHRRSWPRSRRASSVSFSSHRTGPPALASSGCKRAWWERSAPWSSCWPAPWVCLLALGAANVTTLLLVRGAERQDEMAVRAALGATTRRIAALVLTESMAIGVAGGVLGIALSTVGVRLLVGILPAGLPRREEITLDLRVLAASAALTLTVTALVGLVPAWQSRRVGTSGTFGATRTMSRAGERQRGLLVALEMTLALILVVGATLMGRTLVALYHVDSGLESDHLLTMKIEPDLTTDDEYRVYWKAVLERVNAVPGVRSAATILHLPASGRAWDAEIVIEGRPLPTERAASQGPLAGRLIRLLPHRRRAHAPGAAIQ